jgi:hypothetical protein
MYRRIYSGNKMKQPQSLTNAELLQYIYTTILNYSLSIYRRAYYGDTLIVAYRKAAVELFIRNIELNEYVVEFRKRLKYFYEHNKWERD